MLNYILIFIVIITIVGTSISSYGMGVIKGTTYESCSIEEKQSTDLYLVSAIGLTASIILCVATISLLIIISSKEILRGFIQNQ